MKPRNLTVMKLLDACHNVVLGTPAPTQVKQDRFEETGSCGVRDVGLKRFQVEGLQFQAPRVSGI